MCYYGRPVHLDSDGADHHDEVVVEQQPCGGNSVVVYTGKLLPGGEFSKLTLFQKFEIVTSHRKFSALTLSATCPCCRVV